MASKTPKSKTTTATAASEKKEPKLKAPRKSGAELAAEAKPAPTAAKPAVKKPAKPTTISAELIAQRAYYIAEERQRTGALGDSTQDWLEAEKQLKSELKPKKVSPKKAK